MTPRWRWILAWLLLSVAIPLAHLYWRGQAGLETSLSFRLVWSGLYLLFGVLLLGSLARWRPDRSINDWRFSALFGGSLYAAVEVWLVMKGLRGAGLEVWMAALLGLTLSLILTRWIPEIVLRRWLALERRGDSAGQNHPAAG